MTKDPAILTSNSGTEIAIQYCPCGSQLSYPHCCQPTISGLQQAATAEALMRSRYSAFALGEADYLIATTHPDYRQGLDRQSLIDPQMRWLGLQIIATTLGGERDASGQVRFIATFIEAGQFGTLEENSSFSRIDQRWYYRNGDTQVRTLKPERNAPCPCGSTLKFKRCCGKR
ncbi:MAG: YchJ family metal-binding protein [Motiliproteus sp.]